MGCAVPENVESEEYRPVPSVSTGANGESDRVRVSKVSRPIFEAAIVSSSGSAEPDSMAIGVLSGMSEDIKRSSTGIVWRPNNYRRKMYVTRASNSTTVSCGECCPTCVSYGKRNRLLFIRHWPGVLIQAGPRAVVAIWSQEYDGKRKRTYHIVSDSEGGVEERLTQKREEIRAMLDEALSGYLKMSGAFQDAPPMWDRYEDWIKGESFIDAIPEDTIIHDTYFKKVYGKGIEFKQTGEKEEPVVHLKNYIKNRAIEDFTPEIVREIRALGDRLAPVDALQRAKDHVKRFPDDLLSAEGRALVGALSSREKDLLSEWTFERFGGVRG